MSGSSGREVGGASVRARGWGWRHGGRRARAVSGLDLDVAAGERVLLLGASGAGKSTLLAALAGLLEDGESGDAEGELLVEGAPPQASRGRTGLLLQDPDAHTVLARCGDDVAFGCENIGVPREETWRRVDAALAAVGLPVRRDRPTAALSGGERQRLALAGVLAMGPGLLLLDEPTANLDPGGVLEVRDAVVTVQQRTGATLIVVEHRVDVWSEVVDRAVVLGPDGVLADGAPRAVLAARGDELAAAGVWVPGRRPSVPRRAGSAARGADLLTGAGLDVGRPGAGVAARGLDLRLGAGTCTAVTGPNGSGKSTLALTVAGLLPPLGGRVTASRALRDGLGRDPLHWRARELVRRIGTVFQDPEHQFLTGTVADELAHGPRRQGLPTADVTRRVDELLARLRLDRLAAANPFTLSGGEKRRLSVGTAMAIRPGVLVLDEPTFGQDARTWAELVALLAEVADAGVAVLAVTHDTELVDVLADAVVALPDARPTSVGVAT